MRRYQYPNYGNGGDWLSALIDLFLEGGCAVLCLTLVVLLGIAAVAGARTFTHGSAPAAAHHQRR